MFPSTATFVRGPRFLVGLAFGLAALGCGGYGYTITSDLNEDSATGQLNEDGFALSWSPGSSWGQGHCLDFTLRNQGRAVYWVTLTLELDQAIDDTSWTDGATFDDNNTSLVVTPTLDGAMENGDSALFNFCIEPASVPVAITRIEYGPVEAPTPTVDPDATPTNAPGTTPAPGETSPPAPPIGDRAVEDDPIYVIYRHTTTSKGGGCLDMEVINGSNQDISDWELAFIMEDSSGEVTDWWGAFEWAEAKGGRVNVRPDDRGRTLYAHDSVNGTLCVSPRMEMIDLDATVTFASDGG